MLKSRPAYIWRGWCERCPRCGRGKLFACYLKPRAACLVCGEDLSTLLAEDGPAWLTIILTGHFTVPIALYLSLSPLPRWQAIVLLFVSIGLLALMILPRAKGVFMNMLWFNRQNPIIGNGKYDRID